MAADAEVAGAEVLPEDELSPDLCLREGMDLSEPFADELFASTGRIGVVFSLFCSRFIFCFRRGRGGDVLLRGAVVALAAVGPKLGSTNAVADAGGAVDDMETAASGAAVQVGLLLQVMICRGVTCATIGAVEPICCCCCCCCCCC